MRCIQRVRWDKGGKHMSRLDLAFMGRDAHPIIVKRADQIIHPDLSFWRGLLVAFPVALAIWGGLILLMVAWG